MAKATAALAAVGIRDARGGFELAFAIPDVVGENAVVERVAAHVIAKTGKVIRVVGGFGEAGFLGASRVGGVGCGSNGGQFLKA